MDTHLEKMAAGPAVRLVAGLAAEFGVNAYLAGGGVRDCLLGRKVNDLDFALGGAGIEIPRRFAEQWGGTFFWLDEERLQARVVKKTATGSLAYDFAPLRGATIEDDLRLRDFTINALAMPVTGGRLLLIDPLQGETDLNGHLVRACSDQAFDDDPLRLLRALRFAAELGFDVEDGTWSILHRKAALLAGVAAERIRDELFRILAAPGIGASLTRLHESGLLRETFPPELRRLAMSRSSRLDRLDRERHISHAVAVERVCGEIGRLFPRIAPPMAGYLASEAEGGVTVLSLMKLAAFLGRIDRAGIAALAEKLRLGTKASRFLGLLCGGLASPFASTGGNLAGRALFRFFRDREPAGPALVLLALTAGEVPEDGARELLSFFVRDYDPAGGDLLLTGHEVMAILGTGPGKEVGEAMERLREAEGRGLVNNREEARAVHQKPVDKRAADRLNK